MNMQYIINVGLGISVGFLIWQNEIQQDTIVIQQETIKELRSTIDDTYLMADLNERLIMVNIKKIELLELGEIFNSDTDELKKLKRSIDEIEDTIQKMKMIDSIDWDAIRG
tara:strand:- start:76 stop:408 length:333 start_codon:yes stop_codon:yes gene_type:complete